MNDVTARRLRLLAIAVLVVAAAALTGCVDETTNDDEIVPPGETNNSNSDNGNDANSGGDNSLHLEESNETVEVDSELMQPPPDPEEAGLSTECTAELSGYSWTQPGQTKMPEEPPLHPRELEVMIHDRVNSIREAQGADELYCDDDLRRIAIDHGENMHEHGFVGDTDHEGLDPLERMWHNDYQCDDAGQNHLVFVYHTLVKDQSGHLKASGGLPLGAHEEYRVGPGESGIVGYDITSVRNPNQAAREVVNSGWYRGEDSREIMLDDYSRQGVGVYYDYDSSIVYVTQMLC